MSKKIYVICVKNLCFCARLVALRKGCVDLSLIFHTLHLEWIRRTPQGCVDLSIFIVRINFCFISRTPHGVRRFKFLKIMIVPDEVLTTLRKGGAGFGKKFMERIFLFGSDSLNLTISTECFIIKITVFHIIVFWKLSHILVFRQGMAFFV